MHSYMRYNKIKDEQGVIIISLIRFDIHVTYTWGWNFGTGAEMAGGTVLVL